MGLISRVSSRTYRSTKNKIKMSSSQINRRANRRGKRPQRMTSNVFAMFDQTQIQEFKEAFNMIDDDSRDQVISASDLKVMFASLGKDKSDDEINEMISMAPGPINFTMFLTMFGEKLNGTDPEDVIKNAFACFDDSGSGTLDADHLKELLMTMGDRFSEERVDELLKGAPIDDKISLTTKNSQRS